MLYVGWYVDASIRIDTSKHSHLHCIPRPKYSTINHLDWRRMMACVYATSKTSAGDDVHVPVSLKTDWLVQ
jgi:hypothetical protein